MLSRRINLNDRGEKLGEGDNLSEWLSGTSTAIGKDCFDAKQTEANAEVKAQDAKAMAIETARLKLAIAEKVGITATGEQDQNELVLNDNQPPGITRMCREVYQEFRRVPRPFFIEETGP
jgi:hypothetical protein